MVPVTSTTTEIIILVIILVLGELGEPCWLRAGPAAAPRRSWNSWNWSWTIPAWSTPSTLTPSTHTGHHNTTTRLHFEFNTTLV